jgi:hypothetical protein
VDQLFVGCHLPVLFLSVNEKSSSVSQACKPKDFKDARVFLTTGLQTLTMHSCQSQSLKDTDKKLRNRLKPIKDSNRVAQTFWMKSTLNPRQPKDIYDQD